MPLHDFQLRLAVVQVGMVSSIGADVNTSCASARAGLVRPSELAYSVFGPDGDKYQATGHQAEYITAGFRGDGRLIRLLAAAIGDLSANVAKEVWPAAIDIYVAIPASFRDDPNEELVRSSSPWEAVPTTQEDLDRGKAIAAKAMTAARIPSKIRNVNVIARGQASVGVALEAAALHGNGQQGALALVLAVDSPVDLSRVASLDARGRLKGPNVPTGVAPGEIGAAMLVANGDLAGSRQLSRVGEILQPQSVDAVSCFNTETVPDGRALSSLASSVIGWLPPFGVDQHAWCIADLNGETFRAREWGTALVHMNQSVPAVDTRNVWLPAIHFGEAGSATGLAATALALRSFARRYAPTTSALILSAADGPTRAGFAVVGAI
jgi:3-oxoacyl-[acyl-carrier-protein] synthase-1